MPLCPLCGKIPKGVSPHSHRPGHVCSNLVHAATAMQYIVVSQPQSQLVSTSHLSNSNFLKTEHMFDCVYRESHCAQ